MKKYIILASLAFAMAAMLTPPSQPPTLGPRPEWIPLCDDATATVYHAVPAQCNADVTHTASMRVIDPQAAGSYRILAMERTMMAQYGISYGDTVLVKGCGSLDGIWTVDDTMNRRFKGQHKVDLLVDRAVKAGKWENVTIYRKHHY